jgi:hypothetical protein
VASEKARRARVRRALAKARRENRKLFVQVVGECCVSHWREAGDIVEGPWFDEPHFVPEEWSSRAQVGSSYSVSGHTRVQRIW